MSHLIQRDSRAFAPHSLVSQKYCLHFWYSTNHQSCYLYYPSLIHYNHETSLEHSSAHTWVSSRLKPPNSSTSGQSVNSIRLCAPKNKQMPEIWRRSSRPWCTGFHMNWMTFIPHRLNLHISEDLLIRLNLGWVILSRLQTSYRAKTPRHHTAPLVTNPLSMTTLSWAVANEWWKLRGVSAPAHQVGGGGWGKQLLADWIRGHDRQKRLFNSPYIQPYRYDIYITLTSAPTSSLSARSTGRKIEL